MLNKKNLEYLINDLKNGLSNNSINKVNELLFSFKDETSYYIDIILVLGSSSTNRIIKTLEVYQKIRRPIFISGGIERFNGTSEAIKFKQYLLENNVAKEMIYIDDLSTNTSENFSNTFKLIKEKFGDNKNILLITSSQHMLRALLTAEKIKKEKNYYFQIYTCPSYPDKIKKDNWYLENQIINIIIGELERLIKYNLV